MYEVGSDNVALGTVLEQESLHVFWCSSKPSEEYLFSSLSFQRSSEVGVILPLAKRRSREAFCSASLRLSLSSFFKCSRIYRKQLADQWAAL